MIKRALVHISGPPGSGKTLLIEHLLRSSRKLLLAVRCSQDERLRQPRESAPRSHREIQRYLRAGASRAAVYRFPPSHAERDSFFMTEFMMEYTQAVLIEGDRPFHYLELSVYVTPPPSPGESLLTRTIRDHARQRAEGVDALERLVQTPDGLERLLAADFGSDLIASLNPDKTWLLSLREEFLEIIEKTRQAPPPLPTEHWALSEGFQGIEQAQVVVINVRNAAQRERGEEMRRQVVRLRKDEEVYQDILGWRGSRVPITAVACDLSDQQDAGTKKAVKRIKRVF